MIAFSIAGFVSLYALQRLQNVLPLNPQGFDAVPPDLAFNTSISFITNTNWQNYGGETTMSHLTQMLGLTVHNFLSAATGLAMAFALVRAFARSSATTVGNFWVDMTRIVLYILLPISIVIALVFVALGVPQTLAGSVDVTTLEGAKQTISLGPMASQEIIKELGTNGGGFFNANSAHPFENPNAWTNIIEIWALLLIPFACVLAFGRAVGDLRQGRAILVAMGDPARRRRRRRLLGGERRQPWRDGARRRSVAGQYGRQGGALRRRRSSALFAAATTGTSTGAVNAMHDSLTPLGGLVPLFNLLAGCIWPGGVGAGLYGFLVVAVIAVFVAGLMVGRTPEYLGKKIEIARDEARHVRGADLSARRARLLGGLGAAARPRSTASTMPGRTGCRRSSTPTPRERQQRLGLRRAQRQHALVQHDARHRHADSAASPTSSRCWRSPAGWPPRRRRRPRPAPSRRPGRCSSACCIGVIVILYLLQYFPALALGPVVEHFLMLGGKAFDSSALLIGVIHVHQSEGSGAFRSAKSSAARRWTPCASSIRASWRATR